MLIVAGRIYLKPGVIREFMAASVEAMAAARATPGCRDFVVAPDPLEADRVNVYEEWESEQALLVFRGSGPSSDLRSMIVRAEVARHLIASSGAP